jgi:hypothetical protein
MATGRSAGMTRQPETGDRKIRNTHFGFLRKEWSTRRTTWRAGPLRRRTRPRLHAGTMRGRSGPRSEKTSATCDNRPVGHRTSDRDGQRCEPGRPPHASCGTCTRRKSAGRTRRRCRYALHPPSVPVGRRAALMAVRPAGHKALYLSTFASMHIKWTSVGTTRSVYTGEVTRQVDIMFSLLVLWITRPAVNGGAHPASQRLGETAGGPPYSASVSSFYERRFAPFIERTEDEADSRSEAAEGRER